MHPDALEPLLRWYKIAKAARWDNLTDVRSDFGHADSVGKFTVFNIAGNKYRLVVDVAFRFHTVYVLHILTHHEYSKGRWKV